MLTYADVCGMEKVCSLSATFTDCYVGDGWAEATLKYLEAQPAGIYTYADVC